MNDRIFLQTQAVQLRQLLDEAHGDPILAPQLEQRLRDVEEELRAVQQQGGTLFHPTTEPLPRAAIFLRGGGVQGEGIRPSLAGEALIQYEKMFVAQALHDEREAARMAGRQRRRRGAPLPSLLFVGTPRGSFGLEFVPQRSDDENGTEVHEQALRRVMDALVRVSTSEDALEQAITSISPRVLQPMKKFLDVLAEHGAELRLASGDRASQVIGSDEVKRAAERLDREWIDEEIQFHGTFRGLTRESGVFDLNTEEFGLVTGIVADGLTEDDLERIDQLTNRRCVAYVQKTTLRPIGGGERVSYVLIDAKPYE